MLPKSVGPRNHPRCCSRCGPRGAALLGRVGIPGVAPRAAVRSLGHDARGERGGGGGNRGASRSVGAPLMCDPHARRAPPNTEEMPLNLRSVDEIPVPPGERRESTFALFTFAKTNNDALHAARDALLFGSEDARRVVRPLRARLSRASARRRADPSFHRPHRDRLLRVLHQPRIRERVDRRRARRATPLLPPPRPRPSNLRQLPRARRWYQRRRRPRADVRGMRLRTLLGQVRARLQRPRETHSRRRKFVRAR